MGNETREQRKELKYQEECQEGKDLEDDIVVTRGSHTCIQVGVEGIMGRDKGMVLMERMGGVKREWEEEG